MNEIKPLGLLSVLQRMEKRGAPELAGKVRQRCSEVFRYAIVTARAEYNPAADLGCALQSHRNSTIPFLPPPSGLSFCKSYQATL
ncbi:phage integrase central domain-containing protein [Raoultella terrigena]|uniref:phage integrase central domain-containing protein n=1 Tax=Raoultella terrigena TaxID=577 RepID=UPI0039E0E49D